MLQGERPMAPDNRTLGRFVLDGIPPAPRGMPQIEVTFDIDANGILSVSAKDKGTGKEQHVRIESSSGLSKDEVEQMRKEAEEHAAEDAAKKTLVEARNKADHMVYEIDKLLKEHGEKVDASVKAKIEAKKKAVEAAKDGDDPAAIEKAIEALMTDEPGDREEGLRRAAGRGRRGRRRRGGRRDGHRDDQQRTRGEGHRRRLRGQVAAALPRWSRGVPGGARCATRMGGRVRADPAGVESPRGPDTWAGRDPRGGRNAHTAG